MKVRASIIEPYYSEAPWFESEVEMQNLVRLDSDSDMNAVKQFILVLFGYNDIDFGDTFEDSMNNLLIEESCVVSGGPVFEESDLIISPSCCSGLEDIENVLVSIKHKNSPWLGHDPTPGISYSKRGNAKVWSDDPDKSEKVYSIGCTYKELLLATLDMIDEFERFLDGPLSIYIARHNLKYEERVIGHLKKMFIPSRCKADD